MNEKYYSKIRGIAEEMARSHNSDRTYEWKSAKTWVDCRDDAMVAIKFLENIFELGYEHGFSNALMGGKPVQSCLDLKKELGLIPETTIEK
jgi:hypothetical protein